MDDDDEPDDGESVPPVRAAAHHPVATVEWWRTPALYKGPRLLTSPESELLRSRITPHPNLDVSTAVAGVLTVFSDRVEFAPSLEGTDSVVTMPFDIMCATRRQVGEALVLITNEDGQLVAHTFCEVFRAIATHTVIHQMSEFLPNKRPVFTAQYMGRLAYPDHTYWAQNMGECVVGVIPQQHCVITNLRVIFERLKRDYDFFDVECVYVTDAVAGGIEILIKETDHGTPHTVKFEDFPLPWAQFLLETWLAFMYADVTGIGTRRLLSGPKVVMLGALHRQFAFLDPNHDGSVSPEELADGLGPVLAPRVQELLAHVDADSDGQMSFREFLTALSVTAIPTDSPCNVAVGVEIVTLGHRDWVLGTLVLFGAHIRTDVEFPVSAVQVRDLARFASQSGREHDSVVKPGTVLLRTHGAEKFSQLRAYFDLERNYFESLNIDDAFDAMMTGQDMGILNCVPHDTEGTFRYTSRDGLFNIQSVPRSTAVTLLNNLPKSKHDVKGSCIMGVQDVGIGSVHFLGLDGTCYDIYFTITCSNMDIETMTGKNLSSLIFKHSLTSSKRWITSARAMVGKKSKALPEPEAPGHPAEEHFQMEEEKAPIQNKFGWANIRSKVRQGSEHAKSFLARAIL